ncbi:MAG: hypothetical protein ACUVUQ_08445 [Thermodesulfovibrionales bacterium]
MKRINQGNNVILWLDQRIQNVIMSFSGLTRESRKYGKEFLCLLIETLNPE